MKNQVVMYSISKDEIGYGATDVLEKQDDEAYSKAY